MEILLLRGERDEPVLSADVVVIASQRNGVAATSQPATRGRSANRLVYATELSLPNPGPWTIAVVVTDDSANQVHADFETVVQPDRPADVLLPAILFCLPSLYVLWRRLLRKGRGRQD